MRRELPVSSILQDAAFALYECLSASSDLALDAAGELRVTCLGVVEPATRGLAFTCAGDATLELAIDQPAGRGLCWVHAACDERGPQLSVYLTPERPALVMRFAPPAALPLEDGRYLLRERPTFSSHDGLEDVRKAEMTHLARAFRVPQVAGWLHLGSWDSLEKRWQADAAGRVLSTAVLLERVRSAAR